jgi:hypothetical protein
MKAGKDCFEEWALDRDGVAVRAASCSLDTSSSFDFWKIGIRVERILGVRIICIIIRLGVLVLLHFRKQEALCIAI